MEKLTEKEPYQCTLHLADGSSVGIDLRYEEDWGDVQYCLPTDGDGLCGRIGWGNDSDGHIAIDSVTDADGNEIPLDEFEEDVKSFIVYFES